MKTEAPIFDRPQFRLDRPQYCFLDSPPISPRVNGVYIMYIYYHIILLLLYYIIIIIIYYVYLIILFYIMHIARISLFIS